MLRKPQSNNNSYPLVIIILLALALRLVGIDHTFPYILHPDEPALVRAALALRFDLNPGHFDWPHLFTYLNFGLYKGFTYFRDLLVYADLKTYVVKYAPIIWNDHLIFYLLSRIFAAVLGALTVIPVFLGAEKLFGRRAGLFAALAFAVLPYHVRHSHYALIDVPMVFFSSWALYFSTKIFTSDDSKSYILAGLFVGLAASTKYHGGLTALAVIFAFLLGTLFLRKKLYRVQGIINLLLAGVWSVVGFVIGTPFSVLDFETFSRTDNYSGAFWQFTNVGKASLSEQLNQFFGALTVNNADDFGYVFMMIYVAMFFVLMFRLLSKSFSKNDLKVWLLYIPSILLFIYISGFSKNRTHYYMITYPYVAVICGYALSKAEKYLGSLKNFVLLIVFLIPLYFSVQNIRDLMKTPEIMPTTKIYGGEFERR